MERKLMQFKSFAAFLGLFLIAMCAAFSPRAAAQNNPVPLINQPLVPDAVAPGGPAFTLTVNGTGFVSGSVVNWNGSPRSTTYVSGSQLKAAITAADIATTGTASVTVVNPAPGGTSNVAFFSVTVPTASVTYSVASSPAAGYNPNSVAVGDFNGDGKLDLAVANYGEGTVSILLGDGTGNFTLVSSPVVNGSPYSVATGDFNGDGKLDLVVANSNTDTVSVLLGDGTGNFNLASSPGTGSRPTSVAVGDFNEDGNLDLAVANVFSDTVSILLGDGTGHFTPLSSPAVGDEPISVATGDFNGDGNLDLAVVAELGSISILLGDGTGNFTLGPSPIVSGEHISVATGDFNGDGNLDLAVANFGSGTVSVLLGDGAGAFTLISSPEVGGVLPQSVAVGDFNGDGKLDLATANELTNNVSVLLGDGTGNFTLSSFAAGDDPTAIAVGDFNGDGRLDLVSANELGNDISVLVQVPVVTLSSTTLAFGDQNVGTMSSPMSSTLTNTGSAPLDISAISITGPNPGDFSETNTCGMPITPGASCSITVTFDPTAPRLREASVAITDDAAGSPQMIGLIGKGDAPAVTLQPDSLTFGTQEIGTTSTAQGVKLTNSGTESLTISSIVASGNFSQTNTCGTTVPAGASCAISVTFTPTVINQQTGNVTITDNAYDDPQQTVELTGTGTEVEFSPVSVPFAVELVGTSSAPQQLVLTNLGATALAITGITITGADAGDFAQTNTCGPSIGPGGNCTINVTFTPTAINTRTAQISVSDNGGGSPQTVSLKGTGTEVKLSAGTLSFGDVMVGQISQPMIATLTNIGSTTLTITNITITGKDSGDFSVNDTCHGSVRPGATCNIIVRFVPTQMGTRTADVSITDNGGGSPQLIPLKGTGT